MSEPRKRTVPIRWEILDNGKCVAHCTSWDAKVLILKLLFGSALMPPPNVRIVEIQFEEIDV